MNQNYNKIGRELNNQVKSLSGKKTNDINLLCKLKKNIVSITPKISDEEILELSINSGAKDCFSNLKYHEILTEREDFYKVRNEIEKNIYSFLYSGVEWRPRTYLEVSNEESETIVKVLEALEDDEDVQNTFVNCNIHSK